MLNTLTPSMITLSNGLLIAGVLFCTGLFGLLIRRNVIFMLMSVEIMLNAAALAFIVSGWHWQQAGGPISNYDGQIMFVFIITVAAAEVAIGLALVLQLYKRFKSLDVDVVHSMRG